MHSLWDFRGVSNFNVPIENLKIIANFAKSIASNRGKKWKIAIVTGTDEAYGLSLVFKMYSETIPATVRVFRAYEAAEAWLKE